MKFRREGGIVGLRWDDRQWTMRSWNGQNVKHDSPAFWGKMPEQGARSVIV